MRDETYVEQVYELVRHIPKGRVTTYGAVAATLGLGSSRMVGWALNRNFGSANVPAHRVVNRNGELTGRNHFATPTMMQELLENEGVSVRNDKVQDFERLFWSPLEVLEGE